MYKRVNILALLLVAQLVLAAGIGLNEGDISTGGDPAPLLGFDDQEIDGIILEGPDEAKMTLARKDGAWTLPDSGDFPANGSRVERLIEKLGALRSGAPVATSSGARKRFKVSDEQFERRITLTREDEPVARLYLGSSPGMRLIHARNEESDAIHAVKMAAYDVPVKLADWEDKSVLSLPKSAITAIEVNGLRMERSPAASSKEKQADDADPPPAWQAVGLTEGKRLKPEAADKLAGLLADLRFDHVLGQEEKAADDMENLAIEISLTRKDDETLSYRFGKSKDKEEYTLKVSNRPEYFRLAGYKAKPLIEAAGEEKLTESISETGEQVTDRETASGAGS